jgi:hypothetical protein
MTSTIRGHFDGKVIVPDGPIDLPLNLPLALDVGATQPVPPRLSSAERKAAWQEFFARPASAPYLSAESLRREYLYDDEY